MFCAYSPGPCALNLMGNDLVWLISFAFLLVVKDNFHLSDLLHEEEDRVMDLVQLLVNDLVSSLPVFRGLRMLKIQSDASALVSNRWASLFPNRRNHAHSWVTFPVGELETQVTGLHMHSIRRHENGLKPNALLTDIALDSRLGALADVAYGSQVGFGKAVFVALQDHVVRINAKRYFRDFAMC